MALEETVADIQGKIRIGGMPNEYAVYQGAVIPILAALEWPTTDTLIVYPQFSVEGRKVDYALCKPITQTPVVFLEVKKVGGLSPKGERQLFDYAYTTGVSLLVFTDGQEWDFYLPTGQGSYEQRRFCGLDLLKCDIAECCTRLRRYLAYNEVLNGVALHNALTDYRKVLEERQIEQSLPQAWNQLLDTVDDSVIESLVKRVTRICGYEPRRQICADFLSKVPRMGVLSQPATPPKPEVRPNPPPAKPQSGVGFILRGEWHSFPSAIRVMVGVLEKLTELDPTFPDKFAAKDTRKSRRYIARSKYGLYSERADLCEKFSTPLSNFGWFVGTNYNKGDVVKVVTLACEVAGLQFGQDLILQLD